MCLFSLVGSVKEQLAVSFLLIEIRAEPFKVFLALPEYHIKED